MKKTLMAFLIFAWVGNVYALTPAQESSEKEHLKHGYPSKEGVILYRRGYVLSYNTETKVANWAAYHLSDEYLNGAEERSDDFRADEEIPEGKRSELKDYERSGYDRGHLVPSADMKRSEEIQSESFLLTNMAPQIGIGFNRGIWKCLEEKVREDAEELGDIYVIVGPLYEQEEIKTIGDNKVRIPDRFFKIVLKDDGSELEAYDLPNEPHSCDELPLFKTASGDIYGKMNQEFYGNPDGPDQEDSKKGETHETKMV